MVLHRVIEPLERVDPKVKEREKVKRHMRESGRRVQRPKQKKKSENILQQRHKRRAARGTKQTDTRKNPNKSGFKAFAPPTCSPTVVLKPGGCLKGDTGQEMMEPSPLAELVKAIAELQQTQHQALLQVRGEQEQRFEEVIRAQAEDQGGIPERSELKRYSDNLSPSQRAQVAKVQQEFANLFSPLPGRTNFIEPHIETSPAIVVRSRPYRLPDYKKNVVQEELQAMLDMGVVKESHSDWSSPVVLVPKSNGSVQFCMDNALSKFDTYPMPRIDKLLDRTSFIRVIRTPESRTGCASPPCASRSPEESSASSQDLQESSASSQYLHESVAPPQDLQESVAPPQDHHKSSASPKDLQESPVPLQVSTESSAPFQVIQESSAPFQVVLKSSAPFQDLQESTAPLQCVPESTFPLQSFRDSSFPFQDPEESSAPLQDLQASSSPLQDLQESTAPLQCVPESTFPLQSFRDSSFLLQDPEASSAPLQDLQVSSSPLQDLKASSPPLQDLQESPAPLQCVTESTSQLQHASENFSQLQHASESSSPLQRIPESSSQLQHASKSFSQLQHASESFSSLQHASESSSPLHRASESSSPLQGLQANSVPPRHFPVHSTQTQGREKDVVPPPQGLPEGDGSPHGHPECDSLPRCSSGGMATSQSFSLPQSIPESSSPLHSVSESSSSLHSVSKSSSPLHSVSESSSPLHSVSESSSPLHSVSESSSPLHRVSESPSLLQHVPPPSSFDGDVLPTCDSEGDITPLSSSFDDISLPSFLEGDVSPQGSSFDDVSPQGSSFDGVSPQGSSDGDVSPKGSSFDDVSPPGSFDGDVSPPSSFDGDCGLEFVTVRCRPFYLPREFTTVYIVGVYIPPSANAKEALCELYGAISDLQNAHPDGLFIIAGDFNHANLKTVLPKLHQYVDFATRGANTLDLVYTNIPAAYYAEPRPYLGYSDHCSVMLIPAYRPLIRRSKPVLKQVKTWPEGATSALQDCFECTDWDMFREAATNGDSINLEKYTLSVTCYISKCVDDVTISKTITTANVCALLKQRESAFRSGDKAALKTARAKLSRAIREAKRAHAKKIHNHFQDSGDTRRMWQGIQAITNYKTTSPACDRDASLPDALNDFYARFEVQNNVVARKTIPPPSDQVLCLTTAEVRKTLCRVKPRKSAGPDNIPGRVLRECAEQLADVNIFNISLSSTVVPTYLRTTTIVPVQKKSTVSCLNDYRPVALTPIVMKCFERLVMRHIKTQLPPSLDPMQFAYHPNRSTDDGISTTLHLALNHLDNKDSYVRMLFIDFSSAFNTIIPQHLVEKLNLLGLNTSLCNWILDFLTGRPHKNDESAYREEVQWLTAWCGANNLSLNVDKTKEMVVDFRRAQSDQSPLIIDESSVEIVKSTKFLRVHLVDNLTWSLNTSSITKKAQQHLYFLRRLRKTHLPPSILTMFYRGTIESILSSCITAWFGNCTVSDRKTLQRIVRTAEKIIRVSLPSIMDIYTTRCIRKAHSIVDDHTHPSHTLFTLLPSGKWFQSI
ncbi:hypothetical protein C0J45_23129 [Silurus meridionalis]|nr:hypothetical protein C0J45_23129 [Silurus meridionalis]